MTQVSEIPAMIGPLANGNTSFFAQENLHKWLINENGRDQFVMRAGTYTEVYWNDARQLSSELIYQHQFWMDSFIQWSPLGMYLATVHRQGSQMWGGEDKFVRLMRFSHPQLGDLQSSKVKEKHMVILNFPAVPLLVPRDGEGREDGVLPTWMRPTLRRCVTLEFTCKALDVLVAFLLLLSSFYAVYLLVSPQASSSCKHMSAPLEVEVITKLIPLVMFLPVLLAFVLIVQVIRAFVQARFLPRDEANA
ncbi:eukaryotic translation initiation factor 3 subunit B-like [Panicum miliaceum]|uniref:Eukaryotic translation initiation factor 3 subunit B-like n=1 Tax=Panicum miliaceum TaxID=4540 RepID=A0A3L6TTH5_PANMI|nr:eukaryotic translation initiation factor 3 subunit B-like [Panicum miliaceum]